ncbi:MAG: GYD domain-containing protein [Actinobacteria bacterium]|nr:GYD domain-containing protein [Actinomycetota bacterium]
MPRYLWRGSYTTEGLKGLLEEGGTARKAAVEQLVEALNGKLEAFYYAFGEDDLYVVFEAPDNISAAAGALLSAASGAVRGATIVLLTPEEVDEAAKKSPTYRPPGA